MDYKEYKISEGIPHFENTCYVSVATFLLYHIQDIIPESINTQNTSINEYINAIKKNKITKKILKNIIETLYPYTGIEYGHYGNPITILTALHYNIFTFNDISFHTKYNNNNNLKYKIVIIDNFKNVKNYNKDIKDYEIIGKIYIKDNNHIIIYLKIGNQIFLYNDMGKPIIQNINFPEINNNLFPMAIIYQRNQSHQSNFNNYQSIIPQLTKEQQQQQELLSLKLAQELTNENKKLANEKLAQELKNKKLAQELTNENKKLANEKLSLKLVQELENKNFAQKFANEEKQKLLSLKLAQELEIKNKKQQQLELTKKQFAVQKYKINNDYEIINTNITKLQQMVDEFKNLENNTNINKLNKLRRQTQILKIILNKKLSNKNKNEILKLRNILIINIHDFIENVKNKEDKEELEKLTRNILNYNIY